MDIIQRNFFRLLRSGALNEYESPEPMSAFKWHRLADMIKTQQVEQYAVKGIKNCQFDKAFNMPDDVMHKLTSQQGDANDNGNEKDRKSPTLSNIFLRRRLRSIRHNERHAIDTSTETLTILDIIVENTNHILQQGISLNDAMTLGRFLRTKGDRIDFVKLESWIRKLRLQRMAKLQASILVAVFNFEPSELPFCDRIERAAYKLTLRTLTHNEKDYASAWHFRQSHSGFIRNDSTFLRRNLRRSMRYFEYAPLETMSSLVGNFVHALAEIEE